MNTRDSILDEPIPSQPSSKEVEQMFEWSPQISESFPFGMLNDLSIDGSLDLPEIRQQSHQVKPIFKSLCSNEPRFLDQRNQDKFFNCFQDDQYYLTKPQVPRGGFVTAKPQPADQYKTLIKQPSFERFPFSSQNDECCRFPVQDHFAAGNDNTQHCSQIDCYSDFDIQEFVKPQLEQSNLEVGDVDESPVFRNESKLLSLISAKCTQAATGKPGFDTSCDNVLPEPSEDSLVQQQAPLQHVMTQQIPAHAKSSNMNVEELVKKLVRPFRRALKMMFDEKYKRKHYHWVDANVQAKTFEFFQNLVDAPQISTMIANNKGAFFYLIHLQFENKKSKDSTRGEMQPMDFDTTCYKELFGQKPNKRNLKTFFSQPEIQLLWEHFYIKHPLYKAWKNRLSSFSASDQAKVTTYLQGIAEGAGFDMLR